MKKRTGFTLIELIAVIAIIAIIALIALPTISSLIKETRMKALSDSAYGIIKAGEQYYSKQLMLGDKIEEVTFEFPESATTLELSGEAPKSGTMTINKDGKIQLAITNRRYCATKSYNETKVTVTEDLEQCGIVSEEDNEQDDDNNQDDNVTDNNVTTNEKTLSKLATTETGVSIPSCITNKTICTGENLVAIKVNDTVVYNFYVISDDNSKVTLIMDRNLGQRVSWVSKADYINAGGKHWQQWIDGNSFGPITVLNYLNNQTSTWSNIEPIKEYVYNNNPNGTASTDGYQKLEIENGIGKLTSQDGNTITEVKGISRARMLTDEEETTLRTTNSNKIPTYLYTNLNDEEDSSLPFGYWYLTADKRGGGPSSDSAMNMSCYGGMYDIYELDVTDASYVDYKMYDYGLRPVIELSK